MGEIRKEIERLRDAYLAESYPGQLDLDVLDSDVLDSEAPDLDERDIEVVDRSPWRGPWLAAALAVAACLLVAVGVNWPVVSSITRAPSPTTTPPPSPPVAERSVEGAKPGPVVAAIDDKPFESGLRLTLPSRRRAGDQRNLVGWSRRRSRPRTFDPASRTKGASSVSVPLVSRVKLRATFEQAVASAAATAAARSSKAASNPKLNQPAQVLSASSTSSSASVTSSAREPLFRPQLDRLSVRLTPLTRRNLDGA